MRKLWRLAAAAYRPSCEPPNCAPLKLKAAKVRVAERRATEPLYEVHRGGPSALAAHVEVAKQGVDSAPLRKLLQVVTRRSGGGQGGQCTSCGGATRCISSFLQINCVQEILHEPLRRLVGTAAASELVHGGGASHACGPGCLATYFLGQLQPGAALQRPPKAQFIPSNITTVRLCAERDAVMRI